MLQTPVKSIMATKNGMMARAGMIVVAIVAAAECGCRERRRHLSDTDTSKQQKTQKMGYEDEVVGLSEGWRGVEVGTNTQVGAVDREVAG